MAVRALSLPPLDIRDDRKHRHRAYRPRDDVAEETARVGAEMISVGKYERPHIDPATEDVPEGYTGVTISLRALKAAVRRRRRVWLAFAFAGLVIGAGLHLVLPRHYTAVTNLYLVEPTGAPPSQQMANDLSLLHTRVVAEQALASLHLHTSISAFLDSYRGMPASNVILSITTRADSPSAAVTLANAVANAFLTVRAQALRQQTGVAVGYLQTQIATLQAEMNSLSASIDALSTAPQGQSGSKSAVLTGQRDGDAAQATALEAQVRQFLLAQESTIGGSRVIDPAAPVRVSAKRVTVLDALSGLVAGLGLGLGGVIVSEALSDRPRYREEVAAALRAPVELSVGRYRRPRLMRTARLRRRLKRPSAALQVVERRLRARVQSTPHQQLAIIAVAAAEPAALAVAALALSIASEGRQVVAIDMANGRPLAALFGLKKRRETGRPIAIDGASITLIVSPGDPAQMIDKEELADADAVLVLAGIDPALGAEHIAAWARDAAVVVTAGKATTARIRATGQMLRQAGVTVKSAMVFGADPRDDSVGTVSPETADSNGKRPLETLPVGQW